MAYASNPRAAIVEIIGHRGSPREYRENTCPRFRRAFEVGANAVELDVHGTREALSWFTTTRPPIPTGRLGNGRRHRRVVAPPAPRVAIGTDRSLRSLSWLEMVSIRRTVYVK
jgi:hypothetical protein